MNVRRGNTSDILQIFQIRFHILITTAAQTNDNNIIFIKFLLVQNSQRVRAFQCRNNSFQFGQFKSTF